MWKFNNCENFECTKDALHFENNAWAGHRQFAYDLIRFINPEKVLELGTHYGCSFFAMAQAVKDFRLKTKLFAVDNWEGEEHAGIYTEEVYDNFCKTCNAYYTPFADIIIEKKMFAEALANYKEETFDIIHIDGLHTYNAVKTDFETSLPKLKKDGIVLFHDVYSLPHFGTNRYWQELKTEYENHFDFTHSFGLGILFPNGNGNYKKMITGGFTEIKKIYPLLNDSINTQKTLDQNQKLLILTQQALQNSEIISQQTQNTLTQTQNTLTQTQNTLTQTQQTLEYNNQIYTNNSLLNIIKNRIRVKIVHEKWAKYPKIIRYIIYVLKIFKLLLKKIF